MGVVMWDYFFKDDVDGSKFGHLSEMTVESKGMMDSLMNSSFCECINSFLIWSALRTTVCCPSAHPTYVTIVSVEGLLDQNTTNNVDGEDLYQILVVRL